MDERFKLNCEPRSGMHVHCVECRSNVRWRERSHAPEVCPHGITEATAELTSRRSLEWLLEEQKTKTIKMRGLGDVVAKVAQPVATLLDATMGTNLKGCGGCKKRQEVLNKVVSFK